MTTKPPTGLESLALQADALETLGTGPDATSTTPEDTGPTIPTNSELMAGAFKMARDVGSMMLDLKTPASTLNDPNCQHLGGLWGAVFDKHGVDLNSVMGEHAAEVGAGVGTIIIGLAVWRGIQSEFAARAPVDVVEKPATNSAPLAE